jgi:hypothetical protein
MSDGMIKTRECALYECYDQPHGNSKYCVWHQPIRPKTEVICGDCLYELSKCGHFQS